MAGGERRLRLETVGYWLIGLSLAVGLWRVWQTGQVHQQMLAHQAHLHSQITRFEKAIAHCERLVAVLGASQSEAVRIGGANPTSLRQQLQAQLASAKRDYRVLRSSLEPLLKQAGTSETMYWAVVRTEAEWLRLYSSLQEYLNRDKASEINLETLHAFNLTRQDSLYAALESLHQAATRWHDARMRALSRQRGLAFAFCLLAVVLSVGWVWYFAIRPAQLISRWLSTPDPFPAGEGIWRKLRGTRWEPLAHTLRQQRQRLREVERFIRDLAMGRTPEPLIPLEPSDPLARSSFWLIRRVEEYRRSQSDREAV